MDTKEKKLRNTVTKSIIDNFGFLKEYGYTPQKIAYNPRHRSSEVLFIHKLLGLEIKVTYHPFYGDTRERMDNFGVSFSKPPPPYPDGFSMERYMHQEYNCKPLLSLRYYKGSFEERMEQLFEFVREFIETDLLEVIRGGKWIKVQSLVDLDGYR